MCCHSGRESPARNAESGAVRVGERSAAEAAGDSTDVRKLVLLCSAREGGCSADPDWHGLASLACLSVLRDRYVWHFDRARRIVGSRFEEALFRTWRVST
jgi:hypothetical protein